MLQHHAKQGSLSLELESVDTAAATTQLLIGCAGWSVSSHEMKHFPAQGSHLERYAAVLPAVEINSSFYRPHRAATYARWRDSVPPGFRFSVKLPRTITHQRRLRDVDEELLSFLDAAGNLGEKFGCLLVQLPPSLQYDATVAPAFLERVRSLLPPQATDVACEPRHASWFTEDVAQLLSDLRIARVRADPAVVETQPPQRYRDVAYIRLHGSPVIYHSSYPVPYLAALAAELARHRESGRRAWCVFDNTADGAALSNALAVLAALSGREPLS